MSTSARGGYEYFITFIDDYSRYEYIYLMRHKFEAFDKFKEYKAEVKNHRGIRRKWRTIEVRVSSFYDLIVEVNTSWVNLGSS